MDVAQPLWLPGSPKEDLFIAKHAFLIIVDSSQKQPTPNILRGSVIQVHFIVLPS